MSMLTKGDFLQFLRKKIELEEELEENMAGCFTKQVKDKISNKLWALG
jgi:hypothetical protein